MIRRDWIIAAAIVAAAGGCMVLNGCTVGAGKAEFEHEGVYECRARAPGYEDLPVYTFDTDTAKIKARVGIGAPSSITGTTVNGNRITLTDEHPPSWFCLLVDPR